MKILYLLVSIYLAALAVCVWCGSIELSRFSGGLVMLGGAMCVFSYALERK